MHPVDAVAVADHLGDCSSCSVDAADYRLLKRVLARLRTDVDRCRLARLEAAVEELTQQGGRTR